MASALLQLESELAERLESIPFFAGLNILVEPRKNLIAEISARIFKLKTVLVPKVVSAEDRHPNVHGVYFDDIRLVVGVFQNPLLKGDHPEPLEICEEVCKAFKNWTPDSLSNAINPAPPGIEPVPDEQLNIFNCHFSTKGGFVGALPECAAVTVQNLGGTIALACATPGAAIFYTTDGGAPIPRAATLYTAPIAPVPLKARAWLAGYRAGPVLNWTGA